MENIGLPSKISVTPGTKENESIISIQPCHPGFGTTLGNALRRVLLSSLPGAAVIGFKVKGATHEYTTLPGVAEDIVEISLNLKQLRLKVNSDEPVELELKVKGEKKVTAKDISKNSAVEIGNPDLVIATLTDKSSELDMKIVAVEGRGYVPTESREGEPQEVGMIALDSIFTPVRNVGFRVENVRVGQMTNFENLVLSIETDGTISAEESLQLASQVLIDHFDFIKDNNSGTAEVVTEGPEEKHETDDKEVKAEETEKEDDQE
jgi:DNA-directed RNA polymerase subunit alpha